MNIYAQKNQRNECRLSLPGRKMNVQQANNSEVTVGFADLDKLRVL